MNLLLKVSPKKLISHENRLDLINLNNHTHDLRSTARRKHLIPNDSNIDPDGEVFKNPIAAGNGFNGRLSHGGKDGGAPSPMVRKYIQECRGSH